MAASQVHFCILCNKVPQPQKRAYFRNVTEEPLLSLKELLNKHYGEQEVLRCLEEPVVLCKGACQTLLKKLFKLKQDLQSLEKDVIEKMAGRFKQMEVDTEGPTTPQRSFEWGLILQRGIHYLVQLPKPHVFL